VTLLLVHASQSELNIHEAPPERCSDPVDYNPDCMEKQRR
jgi:hypothetical protein